MRSDGRSDREVREALALGERTVETHVSNALNKLGLASRHELARWAADHGLSAEQSPRDARVVSARPGAR